MQARFDLKSRQFFLTYPRCDVPTKDAYNLLRAKTELAISKYIIAREHHGDGGFHLHCYIKYEDTLRVTQAGWFDLGGHHGKYESVRSFRRVAVYCTKDGDYITNLSAEELDQFRKPSREELARRIIANELSLEEAVQISPGLLFGLTKFKQDINTYRNLTAPEIPLTGVRGIWVWGPSGVGKSWRARLYDPESTFIKPQSKWWDGYAGERTVIIDDYDCGLVLGHYLKIWGDRYGFVGEVKGGSIRPGYTTIIITSNQSIEDEFNPGREASKTELVRAIERRFRPIYIGDLHDIVVLNKWN